MDTAHEHPERPVLIFDGDCPFCRRSIAWIQTNSRPESFEYLPCQAEDRKVRFPDMQESTCMESVQLVLPGGTVYSGDKALPHIFPRLTRYRWLSKLLAIPGAKALAPHVYGWIARHRYALSAIIEKNTAACDNDACDV